MIDLESHKPFRETVYTETGGDNLSKIIRATSSGDSDSVNATADAVKAKYDDPNTSGYTKFQLAAKHGVGGVANVAQGINSVLDKNRVDTRSIIARSRNSVLQFTVYISQSNRVNAAHTISKLFARVYTDYVQSVLSQHPIIDEDEANDLMFLRKFHTNIRESTGKLAEAYADALFLESFLPPDDDMEEMLRNSMHLKQQLTERCSVEYRVISPEEAPSIVAESKRLAHEPLAGFPALTEAASAKKQMEKTTNADYVNQDDLRDLAIERKDSKLTAEEKRYARMSSDEVKRLSVMDRRKRDAAVKAADAEVEDLKKLIDQGKISGYRKNPAGRYERFRVTVKDIENYEPKKAVDAPKVLRDSDIKKINDMSPWMIEANFRIRPKDRNAPMQEVRYVIGIKAVLHMIRIQDLAEDLQELVSGDLKNLRKVRYKTGEISTMEYLFDIKNLKADAAKHINYNKRWVNSLKRLSDYEKLNGSLLKRPVHAMTGGAPPIPNATLVLTQTDVVTLTNQTGIDLSVASNAAMLAKRLFMISVAIIDASAGTMRVLFHETSNDWDVQSLASLEAELAKTDNSQLMKELNRVVNR